MSRAATPLPERLFPPLSAESSAGLAALLPAVEEAAPLPSRFRRELPRSIRSLWAELTHARDERQSAYLSRAASIHAYLRYFLPWNVYRFCRLLAALDLGPLETAEHPVLTDLGSGPLSFPIALWISRPALRDTALLVQAVDRVPSAMETGEAILHSLALALTGRPLAWKIARVHGPAEARVREGAQLLSAAYFVNEWARKPGDSPERRMEALSRIAAERLVPGGRFLVLDAGEPRAATALVGLRAALVARGADIIAPCPHQGPCPMPGQGRAGIPGVDDDEGTLRAADGRPFVLARGKRPWCHFTFGAEGAPDALQRLSAEAGLPKEGAALSFLYASPEVTADEGAEALPPGSAKAKRPSSTEARPLRVISQTFSIPSGGSACYACSSSGYSLVTSARPAHEPGELLSLRPDPERRRDPKSGALIFPEVSPAARERQSSPEPAPAARERRPKSPQRRPPKPLKGQP